MPTVETEADWQHKRGDRLPSLQTTLKDENGAAVNLTGTTVRFKMRAYGQSGTPKVDQPATTVDAVGGIVRYDWALVDVDTSGWFEAEWEVTYADGRKATFPTQGYDLGYLWPDVS